VKAKASRPFIKRLLLVLVAVLVAAGAFGGWRATDSALPDNHILTVYGIVFDLPWQVYPAPELKAAPLSASTNFKFTRGEFRLEIFDGRLKLNGKEYGPLNQGDHVRITKKGEVFVNGKETPPDVLVGPSQRSPGGKAAALEWQAKPSSDSQRLRKTDRAASPSAAADFPM
jgi:hypothetical protein